MYVAAEGEAAESPGQPVIVPEDPPNFTKCVAQVRVQLDPPAVVGARKLQPTSSLNAGTCAAAAPGITIISGDLATVIPVVWTCCAPSG